MTNQKDPDHVEEISNKLDLVLTVLDDLTDMYLKLEYDLWISGHIQKKYSDDGKKYDVFKRN